jgi:hypothetical protein
MNTLTSKISHQHINSNSCKEFIFGIALGFIKDVEEGKGLGDRELELEHGAVVVVQDGAKGVLLKWLVDLVSRNTNLPIKTKVTRSLRCG